MVEEITEKLPEQIVRFYDPITGGFYRAKTAPEGSLEVDPEDFNQLFVDQGNGKQIVPDDTNGGYPISIDPTPEDLFVLERNWRNKQLFVADVEIYKAQDADDATAESNWRAYRQDLRDWPANVNFPDEQHRPIEPAR